MSDARPPALLHDIVHHAERIASIYSAHASAEAFMDDETARDAVLWNLIAVGEACIRLGDEFHEAHPEVPWRDVIDQRNVIAHGYDIIKWSRIIATIENHLPGLINAVRRILDEYGPPPSS
jgi:uncharacterized protein with HEPN domain